MLDALWPAEVAAGRVDSRTVACVLTHDPKFDVPLLALALGEADLAYVGAMGSRRTHVDRLARLPGVAQMHSSFALRTVFRTTAIPV